MKPPVATGLPYTGKHEVVTYILRFDRALQGKVSSAFGDKFHYFGKTTCWNRRMSHHFQGKGSEITKRALRQRVNMSVRGFYTGNHESNFCKLRFREACGCDICTRILAWGNESGDYSI